ncbi:capping protein inhibiting regulator of actin dynamics-like isoform X2 [Mugil cephalus]|uniref:capping protein inhibiting regulator of actin dynamics-like isoform X2 n=1 Tax=Mugil cephalus TaxID=48193 RepID=UPI001FB7E978|nr:capping protein inhibiting regulator of actin dynamics-like isoform X2 [Mugil cephalus]
MLEKENTMSLNQRHLNTEIEMANRMKRLTLEERRAERLSDVEVGCRVICDLHDQHLHRQKESVKKKMESMTNELKASKKQKEQLKKERFQWEDVMAVKEEPIRRLAGNDPRKQQQQQQQQQRGREEAEVCHSRKVQEGVRLECLKSQKECRRKTVLCNNWVGENKSDSEAVEEHNDLPSATGKTRHKSEPRLKYADALYTKWPVTIRSEQFDASSRTRNRILRKSISQMCKKLKS